MVIGSRVFRKIVFISFISILVSAGMAMAAPQIQVNSPQNATINDTTPDLNLTVTESSNITYNWNGEGNITGCRECTSYNTTYGEAVPEANTGVLLMHFNENYSSTAYDDSTYGNNGTITGATWTEGRFGNALEFDGNDYVSIPDDNSLDFDLTDNFTMMVWFRDLGDSGNRYIFEKLSWPKGYHLFMIGAGNLRFMIHGSGSNNSDVISDSTYNDSQWHHIAIVRNTSAGEVFMYIDGAYKKNASDNTVESSENSANLAIGSNSTGTGGFFNGTIDELVFVRRALTASEIAAIYNKTLEEGTHNVTVYATNSTTGTQNSTITTFTVDTIKPQITINSPSNITYTNNIDFNITTNEPLDANAGVLIYNIDANTAPLYIQLVNNTQANWYNWYNDTVTLTDDGQYNATFNVTDLAGNSNTSTIWFSIDDTTLIDSCTTINASGTYRLNKSISNYSSGNCINITASDVVFDGQGNTIDGNDTPGTYGIYVYNSSANLTNVIVRNVTVTDWHYGIYYRYAENGSITNNTVSSNNNIGIYLLSSSNNTIANNNASNNGGGGIFLNSSSNYNTLTNNTASINEYGIFLNSSSNYNTLTNNTANSNERGVMLFTSHYNTIANNNASNNWYGIYLESSSNTNITDNTASNIRYGIFLDDSSNNTLSNNIANSNNVYGIYLNSSSNNTIYNNYLKNTNNTYDDSNNFWNTTNSTGPNIIGGLYLGGNYYSDYDGSDTNGDGFGETNYSIPGGANVDYLPLVDSYPPTITINSPKNDTTYNTSIIDFDITVTDEPIDATDVNAGVLVYNIDGNTAPLSIQLENDSSTHWYSLGNFLQNGNYKAVFQAWDLVGNNNSNTTWFTVNDTTKPQITINSPLNDTYNTSGIDFNITVNEPLDTNAGVLIYYIDGNTGPVSIQLVNDSLTHWNKTVNLTSYNMSDGQYNATFNVTDRANNSNTSTVWFSIDTTPPNITTGPNAPSSSITDNSAVITWTTDENASSLVLYGTTSGSYTSNASNTSPSLVESHSVTLTSLTSGTKYYYVVNSTDAVGNSVQSSQKSFTTSGGGSPPGDGGGGGGGGAATSFEVWIKNVKAGQTIELNIDDKGIPYINGLSLTAKQDIYSSKLSITDYDKKPWSSMEEPDTSVFRYFKVSYDKDNYVKSAKFKVSVAKSWLKANDIDPYKFSLYRYTNTWEKLDSKILKEDSKNIYLEATTPGFSYFSLGGTNGSGYKPIKEEEEEIPTVTTTTTTIPKQPTATTTTTVKSAPEKTVIPPPVPPTEGKKKVLYILGILVVLILAAMLYVKKDEIDEIWRNR